MTILAITHMIHQQLQGECLKDLAEELGIAPSTLWYWRQRPPERPTLRVFGKLALYYGFNPSLRDLAHLL